MVTVLKFAMPTLLRLKSRVLAAEEGKLGEREGYGEYEDTRWPPGRLARGHRGMVDCGVSTSFFLPSSPAPDGREKPALIQDANFLLTAVNMRGHAVNIACTFPVPSFPHERRGRTFFPSVVLDLINTFVEYVEKYY